MTGFLACKELATGLGSLFLCSEHGDYQRIRTPYLYPDGDMVDLFCRVQDGIVTVSDLGETTRWLRMQTVSPRRSPKQSSLIEDICLNHGVEFYRGMLLARVRSDEVFSAVVTRVAQAAIRVSDLWFTFRTRAVESAGDEIADFLAERDLRFDRGERLVGRSGRPYTVDFHVRTSARSSLLYVLSTGSRSAARPIVNQVVTAWYDLNHLAAGPEALQFVSLFDDTADVWSDEDLRLVEGLSRLAWLSKTEDLEEILRAAA